MKSVLPTSIAVAVLSTMLALPTMAYESIPEPEDGNGFIGFGIISKPDYEGSDDNKTTAAPFGKYNWSSGRYVNVGGTGGAETAARVSLNLVTTDMSSNWTAGPLLQYRLKRDDDVENQQVEKLQEIDAATELGAFVNFKSGRWSSEFSFAGDVSDEHDGYILYLKSSYALVESSKMLVALGASTSWADSNYMDTYFGVDKNNVGNSGLPFYSADSGFKDATLSLTGVYFFNKTWSVAGVASYTRMLNDAEDSPLVEGNQGVGDKNQPAAIVAVMYAF